MIKIKEDIPSFALFNFTPMKDRNYNDTLRQREPESRLKLNLYGVLQLPEIVSRNIDFFSALYIVGIRPVGSLLKPVFSPHQRRFQMLSGLAMESGRGFIKGFKIPEIGANHLNKDMCKSVMVGTENSVVGKGHSLLLRAREKKDGVEIVVFGVEYSDETIYYMWDAGNIVEVRCSQPCRFEKCDGKYYLLSDVDDNFDISLDYEVNPWEFLSLELVEKAQEGIIVDIDTVQYKVPRVPTVTLSAKKGELYDSGGKIVYDSNRKISDGCYDFSIKDLSVVKPREDRVYGDSQQQVEIIKRCAVSLDEFVSLVPCPEKRSLYKPFKIKLDDLSHFSESLNIYKAVVAPTLTCRVPAKMIHRKDFVRNWLRDKQDDNNCVKIDQRAIDRFFFDDFLYVKDGMLIRLQYTVAKEYSDPSGFSNYPKKGYECCLLKEMEARYAPLFYYKGAYLVFFDPRKWTLNDPKDFDWRSKDREKEIDYDKISLLPDSN